MAVYIDANSCAVRDGDAVWPFDIDCRDGVAHIALDTCRYVLRPLSWREKRNLARFTHLGEQFLQTQFLRLSLKETDAEFPMAGEERAVLSALARWLNAPDGNFGLPLDRQLLASVTLDICRAMNLVPTAFDALDAMEVEMLWQAACAKQPTTTQTEASASIAPGMTRIVVVPDGKGNEKSDTPTDGIAKEISLGNESNQLQEASADTLAEAGIIGMQRPDFTPDVILEAAGENNITENLSTSKVLSIAEVVSSRASNIATMPHYSARANKSTLVPNRFRVDLAVPKRTAVNASRGDVMQSHRFQLNAANSPAQTTNVQLNATNSSGQFSAPTPNMLTQPNDRREVTLASGFAHATTAQINPAPIGIESMTSPVQTATLAAGLCTMTTLQLADQLFFEFAERLDEAAYAVGIDLEN